MHTKAILTFNLEMQAHTYASTAATNHININQIRFTHKENVSTAKHYLLEMMLADSVYCTLLLTLKSKTILSGSYHKK